MYCVSALVQYSFDVEAPFMSCTNFLLVVGLSQQQFDQTLGVDPHSSSSFDQTSLELAFSVSCRQTMWGFLSLTFTQFSEIYSSLETIPPDMIFVQFFTHPDFQAKNLTPVNSVICDISHSRLNLVNAYI